MTIKYLIVDPSFFVRKNGLKKIPRLEKKIAKFELSKLSTSNSSNTSRLEVETTGRTQTISSGGAGGARSRAEFSSKELSMCKPTIVLPDALRVLDELQSGKQTVEDVIENPELKQVFKQWGLGKGFEKRIKELQSRYDSSGELLKKDFINSKFISFTNKIEDLKSSNIYIITVPTPITSSKKTGSCPKGGSINKKRVRLSVAALPVSIRSGSEEVR